MRGEGRGREEEGERLCWANVCMVRLGCACACVFVSGRRARECVSLRERAAVDVCWWELRGRMAAHVWTASEALKKKEKRKEKHNQQSHRNSLRDASCSSFVGRQGRRGNACWSERGKCVLEWLYLLRILPVFFFSPSLFLRRTGTPQLRFLPLSWWMEEASLASLPYLSRCCSVRSACVSGDMMQNIFTSCIHVCWSGRGNAWMQPQ